MRAAVPHVLAQLAVVAEERINEPVRAGFRGENVFATLGQQMRDRRVEARRLGVAVRLGEREQGGVVGDQQGGLRGEQIGNRLAQFVSGEYVLVVEREVGGEDQRDVVVVGY